MCKSNAYERNHGLAQVSPNEILNIKVMNVKIKSRNYLEMLQTVGIRLMKLNMMANFSIEQDNCNIHKTKEVLDFLNSQNIKVIDQASRSLDVTIIENVWQIMPDIIYDEGQPDNLIEFERRVFNVISIINTHQMDIIKNLYFTFRHRLTVVLKSNYCLHK